jgi:hypothetical protein
MQREHLVRLYEVLAKHFDVGELQTLCFQLGLDYDDLGGAGKSGKARELVAFLERRGRIVELLAIGKQLRPDVAWEVDDAAIPPPKSVVASAGRLRITLTKASSGWSLFAENIGDRELTSITITLRPPATLFMSNSDTLITIPRLSAGGRSAAKALTLRAGLRSSSPQPRRGAMPANRRAILSKKDFAEDRRSQVESHIKQVRSFINSLEKQQMQSLGGLITDRLGLQINEQREELSKYQQEMQEIDAEIADYEEQLVAHEQVSAAPDSAHKQPETIVSLAFNASYRVEGSSSERVEGVLPVSLA